MKISILIASKQEPHLWDTINDLEENSVTKPEILWFEDDGRGQRATLNYLAERASGDILVKVDAHCSFGPGFDEILLQDYDEKTIIAPVMYPLNAEQWSINHHNPMSNFVFDTNLVMHHAGERTERVHETMCMQGSFFMIGKKNWFAWNVCDESLGSWGGQSVELGIQAFLHGGVCKTSKKTYYGHLFRHSDNEFPYVRDHKKIETSHEKLKEKYKEVDLSELIKKYDNPCDW